MITEFDIHKYLHKFTIVKGLYDDGLLFIGTILKDPNKTCLGENFSKLGNKLQGDKNLFSTNSSFSSPLSSFKNSKMYNSQELFDKFGLDTCIKLYNTILKKKEKNPPPHPNLDRIINELLKVNEIELFTQSKKYNL